MSSPFSTLDGSRYVTDYFLASNWTRLAWAATFATFVLWGTTWFMRHAFGQADEVAFGPNAGGYGTKRSGVDPELGQTTAGGGPAMTTTDNTNVGTTAGTTGTTAYNEDPARLGGGASTLQNVYVSTMFIYMYNTCRIRYDRTNSCIKHFLWSYFL
jgi:hypothetical protein